MVTKAEAQRQAYDGRGFPQPGEDPELVSIIRNSLGDHLAGEPPSETWNSVVQKVRQYLALENKRKNLVGEGFEDVLSQVISRVCTGEDVQVRTRTVLHDLPGFNRVRSGDKPNKVDVSIIRPSKRTLVTAKWSVRADREKQFVTDFDEYLKAESERQPFEYVFITNEFDPARLMRACEQMSGNAKMFSHVVHISTDALRATYGGTTSLGGESVSIRKVINYIDEGRLMSLAGWLEYLKTST